jgi:hypothetical protein
MGFTVLFWLLFVFRNRQFKNQNMTATAEATHFQINAVNVEDTFAEAFPVTGRRRLTSSVGLPPV